MTQTSEHGNLRTRLNGLHDKARDLSMAIHAAMDSIQTPGPHQPSEWLELHTASKIASACGDLIYQMIQRADAADQPIPYILTADGAARHAAYGPCQCGGDHTLTEAIELNS